MGSEFETLALIHQFSQTSRCLEEGFNRIILSFNILHCLMNKLGFSMSELVEVPGCRLISFSQGTENRLIFSFHTVMQPKHFEK